MKDLYGKKEKHDHKFSNILKGCILAIVMLAPFFAILSKMIYVSVNKNAKDSYSGSTYFNNKITEITNGNDLIQGLTYEVHYTENSNYEWSPLYYYTDISFNPADYGYSPNKNYIGFRLRSDGRFYLYYENNNADSLYIWGTQIKEFAFTYNDIYEASYLNNNTNPAKSQLIYVAIQKDTLDNAIYYAIEQSKNEEILNWTKNTPIYNVINTMNTGLGLSNNHILTYLLTYWSIILAIYIVFDIIIFIFTKITHYLQ